MINTRELPPFTLPLVGLTVVNSTFVVLSRISSVVS